MDLADLLTTSLWLLSFIAGGIGFTKIYRTAEGFSGFAVRLMFGLYLALSVWVVSTYLLWLFGVELKIGTIQDGAMAENWWLPIITVAWTYLIFRALRSRGE